MTTISQKKDTAPPEFRKLAMARLYNNDEFVAYLDARPCETCPEGDCCCGAPTDWLEAAAMEAYVAFTEALDTWVETLIAGRPPDTTLVEWEHRELEKRAEDAAEMRAEVEACPLCGKPSDDGSVHQDCVDYEAVRADLIPAEKAADILAEQRARRLL